MHLACQGSVREQPGARRAVLRAEDVDICAAKDDGQDKERHTAVETTTEQSYFWGNQCGNRVTKWGKPLSRVVTALLSPESVMLGKGL